MKKLTALLFAFLMLLSLCSCGDEDPNEYIGEALLSVSAGLVDSNQYFYNDVFVLGHLECDESNSFEKDGDTFAPVTDTKYTSLESLTESLKGTYTEECVEQILKDYPIYEDIDGKLCVNLSKFSADTKGVKWERNPEGEVELEDRTDDSYTLEYRFLCGKKDEIDEFTFVAVGNGVNNSYRLAELQEVD